MTTYHVEVGQTTNGRQPREFWVADTMLTFDKALRIARNAAIPVDDIDYLSSRRPGLSRVRRAADRGEATWARVVNSATGKVVVYVDFRGWKRTSVSYCPSQPLYHVVANLLASDAMDHAGRRHVVEFIRSSSVFKEAHAPIP